MQTVSYMGNGQTTEFYFNFPYYENSNIVVTKNNKPATDYYIVGNSVGLDANIPFVGGRIVFEHAPTSMDSITISRNLPLSRIVDYQPTAKLNPTVLNQDLNYIMEILKDFQDTLGIFQAQYADIANNETAQVLLQKMNATTQAIENIGDISSIHSNITTLNARTNNLSDYVVASQAPTSANSYTWYRKYKSGWVEQGGTCSLAQVGTNQRSETRVQFPIAMQYIEPRSYKVFVTRTDDPGNTYGVTTRTGARSSSYVDIVYFTTVSVSGALSMDWMVMGIAA